MFHCEYQGSTNHPMWLINYTSYTSLNAQLPQNHFYQDHVLSVTNVNVYQNNTPYQCFLLLFVNVLCAYRSTVGRLIVINCRGKINTVHVC